VIENLNDFELVQLFINEKNEQAFNLIVKRYQENIYWHCRRMLGNHIDADEVTQEVLITIYKKLHTFKYESKLGTWIYTITSNLVLNYIRRKKIKSFLGFDDLTQDIKDNTDIIQDLDDKLKLEKLNNILKTLPEKQRQIFILRNFDELSYEEISQITNTSVGALKASYHHAQKKIMELMKNE